VVNIYLLIRRWGWLIPTAIFNVTYYSLKKVRLLIKKFANETTKSVGKSINNVIKTGCNDKRREKMPARVKVENTIDVYETGQEMSPGKKETIKVLSHWNRDEMVVLQVGKKSVTVLARALENAIKNATNTY
jgi:ribosomal protein L22